MLEIYIPSNTLVVLCGPAGSGKSTFAAKHFKPTQVVSSDECRGLISDDPSNQTVSNRAFSLMHFIIEQRLRLGRLTVADATHLKAIERKPLIRLARRFGFSLITIIFEVPVELCLARNGRRGRVVPEDALLTQHNMLGRTIKSVLNEGFDQVFLVDDLTQDEVQFELGRRLNRRRRR